MQGHHSNSLRSLAHQPLHSRLSSSDTTAGVPPLHSIPLRWYRWWWTGGSESRWDPKLSCDCHQPHPQRQCLSGECLFVWWNPKPYWHFRIVGLVIWASRHSVLGIRFQEFQGGGWERPSICLSMFPFSGEESEWNSRTPSERSVTRSLISMLRTLSLLLSLCKSQVQLLKRHRQVVEVLFTTWWRSFAGQWSTAAQREPLSFWCMNTQARTYTNVM